MEIPVRKYPKQFFIKVVIVLFFTVILGVLFETQPIFARTHFNKFILHPMTLPLHRNFVHHPFNTMANNTNIQQNNGNNQNQSSENINQNNNDTHTDVSVENTNDVSVSNNQTPQVIETASVQPIAVEQPVVVTTLPKTGTPPVTLILYALFPIGMFLRKFAKFPHTV